MRSWWRKYRNRWRDWPVFEALLQQQDHRYFAAVLQVYNDSQVRQHSHYADVRDFIKEVLVSFARHADARHHLVLKHHPMDRGQRDYRRLLGSLSEGYGLAGRVHLPSLLRHARGVVTITSTVGLSALYHDKPLRVMGLAMYDLPGLTFQGPLAQFWLEQNQIDKVLWRRYHAFLVSQTQINGAFYGRDFYALVKKTEGQTIVRMHAPLFWTQQAKKPAPVLRWGTCRHGSDHGYKPSGAYKTKSGSSSIIEGQHFPDNAVPYPDHLVTA